MEAWQNIQRPGTEETSDTCNDSWRVDEAVGYSDEIWKELLSALAVDWEVALVLAHHHD